MKRIRVFENANDLHVRNYIVFGNTTDSKLYYDAAYTKEVPEVDLVDAFTKGALLINVDTSYFIPISINGNVVKTIGEVDDAVALVSFSAKAAE